MVTTPTRVALLKMWLTTAELFTQQLKATNPAAI
jgi:hypothetical protein